MTNLRKKVGDPVAKEEDPLRKQQKVDSGAAEQGGDEVEPDLAISRSDDVEKQTDGDKKPKDQVQDRPQKGEAHPHPQDAEQVVDQADRQPQEQRSHKGGGLVRHVDRHVSGTGGPTVPAFRPGPPRRSGSRLAPPLSDRRRPD